MKETGIIMSGNHPRLILDGIKTMTRRVIKPQPTDSGLIPFTETMALRWRGSIVKTRDMPQFCPYGGVGDLLWVKETWAGADWEDDLPPSEMSHEAGLLNYKATPTELSDCFRGKWRPSIFMPRWASRITLEITEVRVERLQEITDIDGRREGIPNSAYAISGITSFKRLWDSLNAKRGYGWDTNPWVWVIGFKEVSDAARKGSGDS